MDDPELTAFLYLRGRVGLFAALKALGIGPGDEVITQAFTCVAVPEAILATGARVRWVDIEPSGVNMDQADLEAKLSPETKAVVVQHTFGIPAEMNRLMSLASARKIPVIEDCCHTLSSRYEGRRIGTFGAAAFYSFEWGKPIVVGIGGSLRVNDAGLRERIRSEYAGYRPPPVLKQARLAAQFAAYRVLYRPSIYWTLRAIYHRLGKAGLAESNYHAAGAEDLNPEFGMKMPGWQRRLLESRLKGETRIAEHSRRVAAEYRKGLPAERLQIPSVPSAADVAYVRFPLFVDGKEEVLRRAEEARIELSAWYGTPVHPLVGSDLAAVRYEAGSCPNAERACGRVVGLPVNLKVSERAIHESVEFFRRL